MSIYVDYLLLLSPPETVKHEIARYKKASARLIGNFKSMDSPAHISIQHLERQKPFMADKNLDLTEQALNTMPPVLLHMDGFAHFTHLHSRMTIYATIRPTPAAGEWFDTLKKKLRIKKNIIPHITVVRDIPERDFDTLWPHFKHKKLVEPFWIKELTILKRDTLDSFAKWDKFKIFEFKNMTGPGYTRDELELLKTGDPDQINLFI
ncbi:2'-5' RNA ligase [Mucilaginibacter gossypiicola]|uniref:2'-5' RNA ligase n=1 Tax=Mucilaginibacter gossypiicola TaxID=551995 RepID=A0A1H8KGG2_9SPHI|nr:2'-5' RNA ligase family protein [Mucilaginibacter gossypiicola]SEN91791.1 2'-5' RNA ligase [Mucilaginibacter gossypiicola]